MSAASRRGIVAAYRAEQRKLFSQLSIRLLAAVCVLAPFVFAGVLKVQSGSPSDTLFGVWVHSSGFALSLVFLAFMGSWGFPLIAGIVAGDMFSSEDRYGTWKMVLTRSCTRGQLFAGKLWAGATVTVGLVALSAAATLLSGVLLVGAHSLVGLNGAGFSALGSLGLVALSWIICALPALAFMAMAVAFSLATRNGIAGVVGPGVAALVMQLLVLVGSGVWVHMLLVGSAFTSWHALFTSHPYYGPLAIAMLVSVLWASVCLAVSWRLLRRRDFAGPAGGSRQGWIAPVRIALALALTIALLAIAANWGPVGVTSQRLQKSFTPAFNSLTLLQQEELGRPVPQGAALNIVPSCSRRGSTPRGPGDWACTMTVLIPQAGPTPFQQMEVTYDVSVQPDGCYKAQSPPAFIGQQTMRDADGRSVVNPLYTIYGCFNVL